MTKVPLKQVRFAAAAVLVSPLILRGQAAAEYALKSAQSLSVDGSATIAGCPVNTTLLTCLHHSYPRTTLLAVAVLCLVIVRWLTGFVTYRAR
jgi:hypothetical protein